MGIGSIRYPSVASWHISCSHILTATKVSLRFIERHGSWYRDRSGGTSEGSAAAATDRRSPPPCPTACGAAHGAPGVLLPGAVASAAAVISRRCGYRVRVPGEPLRWGGGGRYLQHDRGCGTRGTRMSDHAVRDKALRHARDASPTTTRYHLARRCGTGVSARTNYSLCTGGVSAAYDRAAWPWSVYPGPGDCRPRTPGAGRSFCLSRL